MNLAHLTDLLRELFISGAPYEFDEICKKVQTHYPFPESQIADALVHLASRGAIRLESILDHSCNKYLIRFIA